MGLAVGEMGVLVTLTITTNILATFVIQEFRDETVYNFIYMQEIKKRKQKYKIVKIT